MQHRRGLTLLELMIGVFIIGTFFTAFLFMAQSCEPEGAGAFEEEDEEPGTYISYEDDDSGHQVPVRRYTATGVKVPVSSGKYPSMPRTGASPSPRPTPKSSPAPKSAPSPSPKSGSGTSSGSRK